MKCDTQGIARTDRLLDYPVNEMFVTIQGEATHAGTPAVFIRLQGCAVGCAFCDTKHTWEVDPVNERHSLAVVDKNQDDATYSQMDAGAIATWVGGNRRGARLAVITGGEPCIHDLTQLTFALVAIGMTVQVETSGTSPIRVHPGTWVTVSPKIDQAGGKLLLPSAIMRANEIKFPVGRQRDLDRLTEMVEAAEILPGCPVWLQPLSQSPGATALCVAECVRTGWRLSVQVHKYIGQR